MPILHLVIQLYIYALLASAILSWFPDNGPGALRNARVFLHSITEPVLAPIRRALPPVRFGGVGIDLSILLVLFVLRAVQSFV
jgi:YggT family protein